SIYLLALLFIGMQAFAQQTGTIKGKVTTADGHSVAGVTISLKNTKYSAVTNTNGEYIISKAKLGSYQIISSYVGLEGQEQSATVKAAEVAVVNFTLKESSSQLQEVIVSSS